MNSTNPSVVCEYVNGGHETRLVDFVRSKFCEMLIRTWGKLVSGNQMTEGIECVLKCNLCVVRVEDI